MDRLPTPVFLGFPVAQMAKSLLAMQETWGQSLVWEDPLEEEMATHSSVLAWRISSTEEPGGLQSMGSQRVRHDWATKHSTQHNIIFKGMLYSQPYSSLFSYLKSWFYFYIAGWAYWERNLVFSCQSSHIFLDFFPPFFFMKRDSFLKKFLLE